MLSLLFAAVLLLLLLLSLCVCLSAWEENTHSSGKIRFFADASGELAKATGLDVDAKPLGGVRFKRFSALLQDGKVQQLNGQPHITAAQLSSTWRADAASEPSFSALWSLLCV